MSSWDDSPSNSPKHYKTTPNPLSLLHHNQQSNSGYPHQPYRINIDPFPEYHIPGTNPPNPALLQSSVSDEKSSYMPPHPKSPASSASESRSSPLEMSPSSSEGSSTPVRRSSLSSESRTPPLTRAANSSPSSNDADNYISAEHVSSTTPPFPKTPSPTESSEKSPAFELPLPDSPLPIRKLMPLNERESYTPPLPPPEHTMVKSSMEEDRESYTPPLPTAVPQRDSYTPPLPKSATRPKTSLLVESNLEVEPSAHEMAPLPESISLPAEPPPPIPAKLFPVPGTPPVENTFPETIPLPSSPTLPNEAPPASDTLLPASAPQEMITENTVSSTGSEMKLESSVPFQTTSPFVDVNLVPDHNRLAPHYHQLEQIAVPPVSFLPNPGNLQSTPSPQSNHIGNPFLYYPSQQQPPLNDGNISGVNQSVPLQTPVVQTPVVNMPEQNMASYPYLPNVPPLQNMPLHQPIRPTNTPNPNPMPNTIPRKRMKDSNPQREPVPMNNGDYHYPPQNDGQFPPPVPGNNHNNNNFPLGFNEEYNNIPHHPKPPFFQNGNNNNVNGNPPISPNVNGKNFVPRLGARPPLLRSPILRSPPDGQFPGPRQGFPPGPRPAPPMPLRQPHPPMGGPPPPPGPPVDSGRPPPPAPPGVPNNLWQWFHSADQDKDGYITARELQCILLNGSWSPFSEERCRMMVDMLDRDRTGTINAYELTTIWNCLCEWKGCFDEIDVESFGHVTAEQLSNAFAKFGYHFSNEFSKLVVDHFENEVEKKIMFDDFIHSCIMLKSLTDAFQVYDTNKVGTIDLHYEQFLEMVLDNIVGSPYHPI